MNIAEVNHQGNHEARNLLISILLAELSRRLQSPYGTHPEPTMLAKLLRQHTTHKHCSVNIARESAFDMYTEISLSAYFTEAEIEWLERFSACYADHQQELSTKEPSVNTVSWMMWYRRNHPGASHVRAKAEWDLRKAAVTA